jgi:type II secretory pathway component PulJ
MGFSTIIDIIGSMVIGGFLMLLLFRLNDSAIATLYNSSEELILQMNLKETATLLERDFRRIGYCRDYTQTGSKTAILSATDTSITFLTDVNNEGKLIELKYYSGSTSELSSTPNPRDRFLYRVPEGTTPQGVNLGITYFKLVYFDESGDTLPAPLDVHDAPLISTMEINLAVENVAGYGGITEDGEEEDKYSQAFWRQIRLANKNLQNR